MIWIWVTSFAWAKPTDIWLTPEETADFLKDYDNRLEQTLGQYGEVRIWAENLEKEWVPLEDMLPVASDVPEKYPYLYTPYNPPSIGVDLPGVSTGILSTKAVYLSQCHGWIYYDTLGRFSTQRGNQHNSVEDFHNPEGANQYLIQYLENAGAKVFTAKERDINPNMDIADNDGAGYFEQGTGFVDGESGFMDTSPWVYGENPFDAGSTRKFPANGGGVATWIPDVPEDGYYAVYVSWDRDASNDPLAHYRITHLGGVIDRYFDQRVHGSTWQYVEYLWLEKGTDSLTVELVADSTSTGTYLSADAVRIGGGMGDVWRHGGGTNRPRWEEGAILYTQYNGAPTSVYDPYGSGDGSDPSTRSRWAKWEHPNGEDAVYVSWHSNAGGGTGTETFYYNSTPVEGSSSLANFVQTALIDTIRDQHDSNWANRGVKRGNLAEVNSSYNSEIPSILLELGFHDSSYDMQFLLDPVFRQDASRAISRGIIEYFANKVGSTPIFPPEPPENFSATSQGNTIHLAWTAGLEGDPFGDAPTSYMVYRSHNGRSWDNGTEVQGSSADIQSTAQTLEYFRVVAVNAGGVSFPSETLAVRTNTGTTPILVVSAFDRLQRSSLFWADAGPLGRVKRMDLHRINSFDYVIQVADSVDYPFDSVSNEALLDIDPSAYSLIIWIAGEESTFHETFSHEEQNWIRQFIAEDGKMIVSGAEILWDLDYSGDSTDQAFCQDVLQATMESDDAESYLAQGSDILQGITMDFSFDNGAPYKVEYPDVITSSQTVIARYDTGDVAGVLSNNVALFGFPLETIIESSARTTLYTNLLEHFLPDFQNTEPSTEPSEPSVEPSTEPSEPDAEPTNEPDEVVAEEEDTTKRGCSSISFQTSIWMIALSFVSMYRRQVRK